MTIYSNAGGQRTRTGLHAGLGEFPLFRMHSAQTKLWLISPIFQRQLGSTISKTYRTGVVMLAANLDAIATVDPRGNVTALRPPHRKFEMWQICNMPSIRYSECACRNYWDTEAGAPWGSRDTERGRDVHHPFCQFVRVAKATFNEAGFRSFEHLKELGRPEARPDEWQRLRTELEQK